MEEPKGFRKFFGKVVLVCFIPSETFRFGWFKCFFSMVLNLDRGFHLCFELEFTSLRGWKTRSLISHFAFLKGFSFKSLHG